MAKANDASDVVKVGSYVYRDNASISSRGVPAEVAGKHLELIRTKNGGELKTDDVISDARSHNSPLHSFFEWDDTAAAREHRLWQARHLIANIKIVYKTPKNDAPKTVRAFINVRNDDGEHYYTTSASIMSDGDLRRRAVAEALNELESFQRRYAELTEFLDVFSAIDKALKKMKTVKVEPSATKRVAA